MISRRGNLYFLPYLDSETITKEESADCAPEFARQAGQSPARLHGWLLALFLCILPASEAHALWEWSLLPSTGGYVFPPTTAVHANGLVAYAVNGEIELLRPIAEPFGYVTQAYTSGKMHRRPVMASLPNTPGGENQWYILFSGTDGWLVKLDVTASLDAPDQPLKVALSAGLTPQARDLRRPGCAADTLIAEPVVQRRVDSNAGFTLNADIVIVATAHACGDTTGNQVIALNAADITAPPLWVFNTGEYEVGAFHACLPDLTRNRIHCAAERPVGTFQNAIWSIDTNSGELVWWGISDASVLSPPVLGEAGTPLAAHLYVGDMLGRLHVLDADDGDSVDVATIASGLAPKGFTFDLAVGTGVYGGMIFATSENGVLSAVFDDGSTLTPVWESAFAGGQKVVSAPVPVVALGKIYVGLNDSSFHQLDLGTGSDEAYGPVGVSPNVHSNPVTPVSVYLAGDGVYRLLGTHYDPPDGPGMTLHQYRLPCQVATACTFAGGPPVHTGPRVLVVDDDDNGPDVLNAYSNALDSLGLPYDVWDTRNSDVEPGFSFLGGYTRVIWGTGNASYLGNPFDESWVAGPKATASLISWLNTGQCLLLSSQWYSDRMIIEIGGVSEFLGFDSTDDLDLDAGITEITGTGSVFGALGTHTLAYPFANGSDAVTGGTETAFLGDQGNAGIQYDNGVYRTVFLGFPFEALPGAPLRKQVISRFLDYCALPQSPGGLIFTDGFE